MRKGWLIAAAVCALLAILAAELALSVSRESLSWDEGDHLFAGYLDWKAGDFGLNPEHPPLVKMLAALPLLAMDLRVPQLQNRYFKTEAYLSGRDWIYGNDAARTIFRARMAASLLTLLLALLVFFSAREMFGTGAAFLALALVVFEPNLIAHGAMVTTDAGLACFLLATIFAFYRYVKAPSVWRIAALGLAGGLAAATKHSAILLLPILVLLAAIELLRHRTTAETGLRQAMRLGGTLVAATAIAAVLLWGVYGFRYQARPRGLQINPPLAEAVRSLSPHESQAILALAHWRVLPESYLYGLADVREVANSMPSYIFGQVYAHGVWFYFPVAFVIKSTLALLLLLLLAVVAIAAGKIRCWREIAFLSIPPLFYLLVSMGSQLNIGARHILLIFIFAALLAAGAAWKLIRADRRWSYPIGALLLFHVGSSLSAFPTSYMAYSNELWGGPSATFRYLSDSNTDWGQQLIGTKKFVDQHGIKSCWFAYFVESGIRFSDYRIPCRPLPTPDTAWFGERTDTPPVIEGPVLISAGVLTGFELGSNVLNPYRDFQRLRPDAVIEHGVFVFNGTFRVPFASALGHVDRANDLLDRKQFEQALAEAQTAVTLAPEALPAQMALARVLTATHRTVEARCAYEHARNIAMTMEPSAREIWVPRIQHSLEGK
jgi:hypothetical protein